MRGLSGKNVLVTGASSGIGRAIAARFAHEGASVGINYRKDAEGARETAARLEEAAAEAGHNVRHRVVQGDMSAEEDVVRIVRETIDGLGGLDVLVNNAGIQMQSASHETTAEEFDRVVAVDLRGAFLCAREAIKHFLSASRPGCVLNISSVHQIIPKPGYIGYSAAKGGVANLTRTLALEYAGDGIRVNAVAPGAIITPTNEALLDDPEARREAENHIPLGRLGEGDEIAAVAVFLASDEAAYVTGQTVYADGGLVLYPGFRVPWSSGR